MNDEISSQPQEQKSGFGWGTILFVFLPAALFFNYSYDVTGVQGEFPFVQIIKVTKENRNAKQDNTRLKEKIADLEEKIQGMNVRIEEKNEALKLVKIEYEDQVADKAKLIKEKGEFREEAERLKEERDQLRAAVAALKRT